MSIQQSHDSVVAIALPDPAMHGDGGPREFVYVSFLLHSELHWLDVPQRILHKLGVTASSPVSPRQGSPVPHELLPPHVGLRGVAVPVVSDFDLPAATISSYHDIVAARSAVGVLRRRSDGLERAA